MTIIIYYDNGFGYFSIRVYPDRQSFAIGEDFDDLGDFSEQIQWSHNESILVV